MRAKLLLALGGVFLSFLVSEAALRAASWRLRRQSARAAEQGRSGASERILCLGESTTAPAFRDGRDVSWPAQLRQLLERRHPDRSFEVVNAAVVGTNSSILLARLPAELARHRPDIVVSMIGVNDGEWYGLRTGEPGALYRLARRSRTFRALEYAWRELPFGRLGPRRAEADSPAPELPAAVQACWSRYAPSFPRSSELLGDPSESLALCRAAAARYPRLPQPYDVLAALAHYDLQDKPLAMRYARSAAENGSRQAESLTLYASALAQAGRLDAAQAVFERVIALDPGRERSYLNLAFFLLARRGRPRQAARLLEQALRLHGDWRGGALQFAPVADSGSPQAVARVRTDNYRKLAALVADSGARLAAMQYPGEDVRGLEKTLSGIPGIRFIDNKSVFDPLLTRGPYGRYFTDRFGGAWGHCTPEGNRIIAENAARSLEALLAPRQAGR